MQAERKREVPGLLPVGSRGSPPWAAPQYRPRRVGVRENVRRPLVHIPHQVLNASPAGPFQVGVDIVRRRLFSAGGEDWHPRPVGHRAVVAPRPAAAVPTLCGPLPLPGVGQAAEIIVAIGSSILVGDPDDGLLLEPDRHCESKVRNIFSWFPVAQPVLSVAGPPARLQEKSLIRGVGDGVAVDQ